MQYGFYFDASRCIGCSTCAIACKDWNDILPGANVVWRRVTTVESGKVPQVSLTNMPNSCNHCGKPACEAVCPTKAITKRAEDGIVVVDQDKCIGCKACLAACPFGVPQFGASGKMQKCNLCLGRVTKSQSPACVAACTANALFAGKMEDLYQLASKKTIQTMTVATQPSLIVTK